MSNTLKRKMKLAVFLTSDGSYHLAGWRLPESYPDGGYNIHRWSEFARTMERGKLDMLFIADGSGLSGTDDMNSLSYTSRIDRMDPVTIVSALAMVTQRLGLVCTVSTSYHAPYNVARAMASIDHISGGRAGWNIVTSAGREDALNFGLDAQVPHAERYERAEEFVDVVRGLWDSYDSNAFPHDKSSGRFMNPDAVHFLNHKGKHFSVRGPLNVARSPQGHPVLVQAGSSEVGMNLSARVADVVFTSQSSVEGTRAFSDDVKGRCVNYGRSPDSLKVMLGVFLFIGRTEEEAWEKYEKLQGLIPIQVALQRLSLNLGGIDLSKFDLDKPAPEVSANSARVSSIDAYLQIIRREKLTLREMAMRSAAAKHHWTVIGSPKQIADQLEDMFVNGGADGFNIICSDVPAGLNNFVDLVVPELQARNLFRTEYEGKMLRENLGVSPINERLH